MVWVLDKIFLKWKGDDNWKKQTDGSYAQYDLSLVEQYECVSV